MPSLQNLDLAKQDFERCGFQEIVTQSPKKECNTYQRLFFDEAQKEEVGGDKIGQEVFTLLGAVCSLRLDPEADEVFAPAFVWYGPPAIRAFILDDFTENHLQALALIVDDIQDVELRARVADVLWEKARGKYYSELPIAIEAYFESASHLLETTEYWSPSFDRIQRAWQLAAYARKRSEVLPLVETLIRTYIEKEISFFPVRLIRLIAEHDQFDLVKYGQMSEIMAARASDERNFEVAGAYWDLATLCYRRAGDSEKEQKAKIAHAETFVSMAKLYASSANPNYAAACFQLQQGIEAYRRIGGMQERTQELHTLLLNYQKEDLKNLKEFSQGVDITEIVDAAISSVKGKTLADALRTLAFTGGSPSVDVLQKTIEDRNQEFVLSSIISQVVLDEDGKHIAANSGLASSDPEEVAKTVRDRMYQEAILYQEIIAQGQILPILRQLQFEHRIQLQDLKFLVSYNPFVPPGRELIFAKGLFAGLNSDFLTAVHLLIPQVENSLRYILSQYGVVISSIDTRTGRQEEHGLDALLNEPELESALGKDMIFDLRGLLIERFGSNLRNAITHGLMRAEYFSSLRVIYCWRLILQLCFFGFFSQAENAGAEEDTNS